MTRQQFVDYAQWWATTVQQPRLVVRDAGCVHGYDVIDIPLFQHLAACYDSMTIIAIVYP